MIIVNSIIYKMIIRVSLLIVMVMSFLSCKSSKNGVSGDLSKPHDANFPAPDDFDPGDYTCSAIDSFLYLSNGGVLVHREYLQDMGFNAFGIPKVLEGDSILYFNKYNCTFLIVDVVQEKVFAGDRTLEPMLIGYLRSRKGKYLDIRYKRCRGEKVFLELLDLTFTEECAMDDYHTPYNEAPIIALKYMVESWGGGDSFSDWYSSYSRENPHFWDQVPKSEFPCHLNCNYYLIGLLIRDGWEKGLIKLKKSHSY